MSTAIRLTAGAGVLSLLLVAACGNDNDSGDGSGPSEFSVLTHVESSILRDELATLAEDQCAQQNEALPFTSDTVPQADVTQRATLLASQDALPVMFVAPTAGVRPGGELEDHTLDYEQVLSDLGVLDRVLPAAVSAIKAAYGGRMASLPFQFNIEGIWYNQELFDEHGIQVPETWDQLVAAAEQLDAAGVQPFTASGEQGWTITRFVSGLLFRTLGPDAMQRVIDGEAKLTDPEYVEAASAVAALGEADYFGEGVTSRDIDTAYSQFLNGEAAMMYMGSWFLANIYDQEQNAIGEDAIGFIPFPAVPGGAGSIDQYPANAGTVTALSAGSYSPEVGDWLTCIAENYGSSVLANQSVVSGFQLNEPVEDVPALTQEVQDRVAGATESVLWFEALFDQRTSTDSIANAPLLVTGGMSGEEFMAALQQSLDQAA